ncbi:MAG: hypothetical protein ACI4AM_10485, partial [Muribaculaceae bacterium]
MLSKSRFGSKWWVLMEIGAEFGVGGCWFCVVIVGKCVTDMLLDFDKVYKIGRHAPLEVRAADLGSAYFVRHHITAPTSASVPM